MSLPLSDRVEFGFMAVAGDVASARRTAVFAGMIGVTLFGLFLTPVFYVALRKLAGGGRPVSHHGSTMDGEAKDGEAHGQNSGDSHA